MIKYIFRIVIFVIILFKPIVGLGFDLEKCSKVFPAGGAAVFGLPFSTSSFVSSTGKCAMFGSVMERKQHFVVFNLDQLEVDSARGQGEYLSAYASLSGCSKTGELKLGDKLQKNFVKVYGAELRNTAKQTYEQIEQLISNDPELNVSCQLRS